MKLTGNISIESIIHILRIDLLTSHVPRAECGQGQSNAGWPAGRTFVPMPSWLFGPKRMICEALQQKLIFQTRTQDKDL